MSTAAPQSDSPLIEQIRWQRIAPYLLVLIGLIAYVNSLECQFVFDDRVHIIENQEIRTLWPPRYLTGSRRPLVYLTLAVNYVIDGTRVAGYHLFNLSVHIAAALALFGSVRRALLLWSSKLAPASTWLAFTVALLWMLHPLLTQAVTYVIQRSESLMGMFFILTFYAAVRSMDGRRPAIWRNLAILSCLLGMLTKEVMIVAPVLVLLFDRTFVAGSLLGAWRARRRLYAGLAVCLLWMLWQLRGGSALLMPASAGFDSPVAPASWAYLLTQARIICHYLYLAIWPNWPHALVFDYQWPSVQSFGDAGAYPLLVAAAVTASVWSLWRKSWIGFLGAWFFLILAPTSSVMPVADLAVEHRMYLPLVAVVVLLVVLGHLAIQRWVSQPQRVVVSASAVALVALVMLAGTVRRNAEYQTAVSLWRTVVERTGSSNARSLYSLGLALSAQEQHAQAIEAYNQAIALRPEAAGGYHDRGVAWFSLGKYEQALEDLGKSLAMAETARNHFNLGRVYLRTSQIDLAIVHLRRAIALQEDYGSAYNNLGAALLAVKKHAEAAKAYERVVELMPSSAFAHMNLGFSLIEAGEHQRGLGAYRRALDLDRAPLIVLQYARALERTGRTDESIDYYDKAIDSDDDQIRFEALYRLGMLRAGHPSAPYRNADAADRLARQARAMLHTESPFIDDLMAAVAAERGQFEQAIDLAQRAVEKAEEAGLDDSAEMKHRLERYLQGKLYISCHPIP